MRLVNALIWRLNLRCNLLIWVLIRVFACCSDAIVAAVLGSTELVLVPDELEPELCVGGVAGVTVGSEGLEGVASVVTLATVVVQSTDSVVSVAQFVHPSCSASGNLSCSSVHATALVPEIRQNPSKAQPKITTEAFMMYLSKVLRLITGSLCLLR